MTHTHFVILAAMRTGSNFLESNLNRIDGVQCLGEAFNPHFTGYPNHQDLLGVTLSQRDDDPVALLNRLTAQPGMNGFRFFHDHDPRILNLLLDDPACAKIILTRNLVHSYVSWKIAQATGQWKLTRIERRRSARAHFDAAEFDAFAAAQTRFQRKIRSRLQDTGQSGFYLDYTDLQRLQTLNGLAAWLGVPARLEQLDARLKPQNPGATTQKVTNPAEMRSALAARDPFSVDDTVATGFARGALVRSFVAAPDAPLLFQPVPGGPYASVLRWLCPDGAGGGDVAHTDMNRQALNRWRDARPHHRSFCVLRHPLARAHHAYCKYILPPDGFTRIRATLRRRFIADLPDGKPGDDYDSAAHRRCFEGFLQFLEANLAGQTGLRTDPVWQPQTRIIEGFSPFAPPGLIIREQDMATDLPALGECTGHRGPLTHDAPDSPWALADIHDRRLERIARRIYAHDYRCFGFGDWSADGPRSGGL